MGRPPIRNAQLCALLCGLLVTACTKARDEEESGTALPTGVGSMSDGGTEDASSDTIDTMGGPPRLDVGSGETTGPDPDGPMVCEEDVDIVFVMDVSTSMDLFLDRLAAEILVVDQALANLQLPAEPHYGLVVFVDDVALLAGGTPYADATMLQADFMQWSDFTSTNAQTSGGGFNSTWPENSLDALWIAASGFQWRPQASTLRMIIHTTDDTFWEGPSTQNGENIQHAYAETVQALQDQQVRVFSFTALIGGQCSCEDVTPGWSTPYLGDPTIPDATDGGVFNIDEIISGQASLADAIGGAIDQSICDPYTPVG